RRNGGDSISRKNAAVQDVAVRRQTYWRFSRARSGFVLPCISKLNSLETNSRLTVFNREVILCVRSAGPQSHRQTFCRTTRRPPDCSLLNGKRMEYAPHLSNFRTLITFKK